MKNKKFWIPVIIIILALVGAGYYFRYPLTRLITGRARAQTQTGRPDQLGSAITTTVTIRSATDANQVNAAGNIALASQQSVVLPVGGIVTKVAVKAGDNVSMGAELLTLDTTDLARAVEQAKLKLATAQAALDKLLEPATPADVTSAKAALVSAQEKLAQLKAGPRAAQLASAQAALTAAQASYQNLMAGKTQDELTQLAAAMHKAYVTLQNAQEAYNKIAYRGDIGSTQQAIDLQNATIDYDTAKAAYDQATQPPTQADIQAQVKAIKDAQAQIDSLQTTNADLAAAQATVSSAEATLADLLKGPSDADRRSAELAVKQAQIDLDTAQTQLAQATLRAPITGTLLAVNAQAGQQLAAGFEAATMADINTLELTINVAEVDISKVKLGQPTQITVDALPNRVFNGVVSRIVPSSASTSGVVSYPVTIRLTDSDLSGILPGMTAVASLLGKEQRDTWLVPTNSLLEVNGKTVVLVEHNGQRTRVEVTPGTSEGEWTTVQSTTLQAGDQVVGQVSSFINRNTNQPRGPFGPPGGGRPD